MGPEVQLAVSPSLEDESRVALHDQVDAQLERVGITTHWPVKVTTGYPAATIAKLARNVDASMIVMGLGGHGLLDRVFGDEMALQVLRLSTVPVLAVPDTFQVLPARALVAVDFSSSSARALRIGGPLVRAGGTLTLAHVSQAGDKALDFMAMARPQIGALGQQLDRFVDHTDLAGDVKVERRVLAGTPAPELLDLASRIRAELIITGSHGRNFLSRLLVGSVSTQLLRRAGCAILIAPPREAPEYLDELSAEAERFGFYVWAERLEEFTREHRGQRCRLEIIDVEIGAQTVEDGVPFVGASFDLRDHHVHLMFGSRVGDRSHLTHSIDGVTAIQTLRDRANGRAYLRVAHGTGQTLLTLER
jgi:universal stress protein E